jgi:pimeloyl-[acyl-carrier protein] methyl ester esterase
MNHRAGASRTPTAALYFETRGHGAPLLLLHGWGMNLRVFDALGAALARDCAVTAIDLPGHGRSPWPAQRGTPLAGGQANIAAESQQRQLQRLMAQLPPRTSLLGWSLGGQWALQIAARYPQRIDRLVLLATTPKFLASADWPHGLQTSVLEHFARQLHRDSRQTVSDFLELQVRGSVAAPQVLETIRSALLEHGQAQPPALAAGLQWLQDTDLRALAATVQTPTLVVAGQYDRVTPPAAAAALAQCMPHARLLTVRRAGHAAFLSHPTEVLEAVHEFLSGSPAGAGP